MASVHKQAQGKSPFWYCRYYTADGRQRMRSTDVRIKDDPNGKKAQIICEGWQQSESLLRDGEISQDRILELYNDTLKRAGLKQIDSPSVARWMKDWLASKRKIAPATRIAYEQAVREFLQFLGTGQSRKLENISEKDIDGFVDHLLKEGRSPGTVTKIARKYLSGPFEKARKLGKIRYNPIAATDPLKHRAITKGRFTGEQVLRLVKVADPDWAGAILLGYGSGARLQDVVNARWSDVDLENGVITFTERKTGRTAVVGLHPDFIDWLTVHHTPDDPNAFLFPSLANRTGAGRNGLSKAFERLMDRANIDSAVARTGEGKKGRSIRVLSFHSFRHGAASAIFNSVAIKDVQRRVTGHSVRSGVLDRYTHADLDLIKQAVSLIPRLPKNA